MLADNIAEGIEEENTVEENKEFELAESVQSYDSLFSFVNAEQVDNLLERANMHYRELEVT